MSLQPANFSEAKANFKPMKRSEMKRRQPIKSSAIPYGTNSVSRKKKAKKKVPSTTGVQGKFNRMVRERANWICVRCRRDCSERKGLLHASHFWAVGFTATRFDFDNVDALCYPCHYGQMRSGWEYNKQGDYRTYMIEKLGQEGYDALEQKARSGMKLLDAKELFLSSLKAVGK